MKETLLHLTAFFAALGGFGMFLQGILNSSILSVPLGVDLLMVGLTASHHDRMLYYAAMAAAGSVIGCFTTDWVSRKGGEAGLQNRFSPRQLKYIQARVEKHAGLAIALSAAAPPPLPFTPFIVVAAALQYPRVKLLVLVAVFRFLKFIAEGLLAIRFGPRILKLADIPAVQHTLLAIVVLSLAATAWSVYRLFRSSKKKAAGAAGQS